MGAFWPESESWNVFGFLILKDLSISDDVDVHAECTVFIMSSDANLFT